VFVEMKFYRWTENATSDKWRKLVTLLSGPVFRRVLRLESRTDSFRELWIIIVESIS